MHNSRNASASPVNIEKKGELYSEFPVQLYNSPLNPTKNNKTYQNRNKKMISVLFTNKNSVYMQLGVDCWDIERDALKFNGTNPVICHPPCRLFSRLRGLSTAPEKEKQLAYYSVDLVRKNGGVLEHPYPSLLWKEKKLPLGKEIDEYGGYTILVFQNWFGAKFKKKTLLYKPEIPISFNAIEQLVSQSKKNPNRDYLKMNKRQSTPVLMAKWLIETANIINDKK